MARRKPQPQQRLVSTGNIWDDFLAALQRQEDDAEAGPDEEASEEDISLAPPEDAGLDQWSQYSTPWYNNQLQAGYGGDPFAYAPSGYGDLGFGGGSGQVTGMNGASLGRAADLTNPQISLSNAYNAAQAAGQAAGAGGGAGGAGSAGTPDRDFFQQDVFGDILDPDKTVRNALRKQGISPLTGNPFVKAMIRRSSALMAPIFAQIAANPGAGGTMDNLIGAVDAQVNRALSGQGTTYAPSAGMAAMRNIMAAGRTGQNAMMNGFQGAGAQGAQGAQGAAGATGVGSTAPMPQPQLPSGGPANTLAANAPTPMNPGGLPQTAGGFPTAGAQAAAADAGAQFGTGGSIENQIGNLFLASLLSNDRQATALLSGLVGGGLPESMERALNNVWAYLPEQVEFMQAVDPSLRRRQASSFLDFLMGTTTAPSASYQNILNMLNESGGQPGGTPQSMTGRMLQQLEQGRWQPQQPTQ